MLVLSRKTGEKIRIGEDVWVTIVRVGPNNVRVGIEAPRRERRPRGARSHRRRGPRPGAGEKAVVPAGGTSRPRRAAQGSVVNQKQLPFEEAIRQEASRHVMIDALPISNRLKETLKFFDACGRDEKRVDGATPISR